MDDHTFIERFRRWEASVGIVSKSYKEQSASDWDALCSLYLEANPEQRLELQRLLAEVGSTEAEYRIAFLVYEYTRQIAARIRTLQDVAVLRLGLAAAAIAGKGIDYRDAIVSLALMHHAATQSGINPTPYFKEIADMATADTRKFIRSFLQRSKHDIKTMVDAFSNIQ